MQHIWCAPIRLGRRRVLALQARPRGVSAVELITLLAVLAILVAISVPWMSPVILHYRLRGAAWQLAGDLRLIRQRAVTLQVRFRLCTAGCVLSVPPGAYSIEYDAGPLGAPSWLSDTGAVSKLPQDVQLTATATPVFSANGIAQPVSTFTLTNPIGTTTVTVASTGLVQICEGTPCPP